METSKVPRKKSLRIKTESTDLGDMVKMEGDDEE